MGRIKTVVKPCFRSEKFMQGFILLDLTRPQKYFNKLSVLKNMRLIFLIVCITFGVLFAQSQNSNKKGIIHFQGKKIHFLKASVIINGFKQVNTLKKSDILHYGLNIAL